MSFFTDFLARRHQQALKQPTLLQQPQQSQMPPVLPNSQQQSPLYNTEKFYSITPTAPAEQPKIDTSNAIGSLAEMLGPTPAEREAQQNRLERGRQQMAMWTGLFDGLRQLSNLYYTAKGARPQQYSDPYKTVDENYNREVKRLDDLAQYQNLYGRQLYNLQRQAGIEEQNRALNEAKIDWYKNRDDVARMKAENDRLKAVRVIKQKDGSLWKFDPFTGNVEELKESDPLYGQYMQSVINRNNRTNTGSSSGGRNGGVGEYEVVETSGVDEKGNKWKKKKRVRISPSGEKSTTEKTTIKPNNNNKKPAKRQPNKGVDVSKLKGFTIRK